MQINQLSRHAYHTYLITASIRIFLLEFGFSVSGVYQIINVGMTPFQLIIVGTVLSATIFFFEIPTGIVADVYSRRLSVIIGIILTGIGFIIVGLSPTFEAALFSNFLWGLSNTFISGAFTAWIVDEIGQQHAEKGFLRRTQLEQIARVSGLFLGAIIGSFAIVLPMLFAGVGLLILGIFLIMIMPETGFTPISYKDHNTWNTFFFTFRVGLRSIREHPVLRALPLIFLIRGASLVGFYRLWEKHFIDNFTLPTLPVPNPAIIWFAALALLTGLLTAILSGFIRTRIVKLKDRGITWTLVGITATLMIALVGFGATSNLIVAIFFFLIATAMGDLTIPILDVWTNRHIPSEVRATVLSMYSQTSAVGEIVAGPAIGVIGNTSMRLAMFISAGILVPTLLIYNHIARYKKTSTIQ